MTNSRLYVSLLFFLIGTLPCIAQVDTEFWFAPPDITSGHGDRPIYIRISTLDKPAEVRITQPARDNMQLALVSVAANSTQTVNLTNEIAFIETSVPASVMETGIKITSSAPITAYYEVGAQWNAEIFVLKGRNSIGNKFVIPGQNFYHNSPSYSPAPVSSFDIVATQNNTVVTVKPTKPIAGHSNEKVIVVKLNEGETYSFYKTSQSADDNPAGTIVESNKPIAITIKDDSVINGGCRDLLGDQLVPVAVAGSEYIVMKGFLNSTEYIFITATEDNTKIYIGGSSTPSATLRAGELFRLTIVSRSTYIVSDKTIYVFHVTGFGCEMGMALLPSITCKGSQQIGFSRTTSEFFGLNIMVRKEGIGHFQINGSQTFIPASFFSPVPGTNDTWYAAQMEFSTLQIPVGQGSLISNSRNSFQAGIINGNESTTCRYGYFSAFSTLFIGDDFDICEGQTATLDAGPGKESYLWNTGATSQQIGVVNTGTYWVKVEREDCILVDTVKVNFRKGSLDLGADTVLCKGEVSKIDGKKNFSWNWSDGSKSRYLQTALPGKYWLSVFDYTGCLASDTINITTTDKPVVDLGNDIVKCPQEKVVLDATYPGATYLWEDGTSASSRTVKAAGVYTAEVNLNGCRVKDSVKIENLPGPLQDTIWGSPSVCPGVQNVEYGVAAIAPSSYQWFVDGGAVVLNEQHQISVNWGSANSQAMVKALITDGVGCKSDTLKFPVRINVELLAEVPEGPDTLCLNKSTGILYSTPITSGSVYEWHITGGKIISGQGSTNATVDWNNEGVNRLWITETSVTSEASCRGTSPELLVHVFKDTTFVEINFVSVDTLQEWNINLSWTTYHRKGINDNKLLLYKRATDETSWHLLETLSADDTTFTDLDNETDEHSSEYYISFLNRCDEQVASPIHRTMFLTGETDTLNDIITLQWNHYQRWQKGVERYEVWRQLEKVNGYKLLAAVPGDQNIYSSAIASDGFNHRYIIRAIERDGKYESWSNDIGLIFTHEVFVPNVFTPNGDALNQYFHIRKIELYPKSRLTILDRWGKVVFESNGYQNDWDGEDVSSGVYYYSLYLGRNKKILKGPLSILK